MKKIRNISTRLTIALNECRSFVYVDISFLFFFIVEKHIRAGQATDESMAHVIFIFRKSVVRTGLV
jgi:hypothetical protein